MRNFEIITQVTRVTITDNDYHSTNNERRGNNNCNRLTNALCSVQCRFSKLKDMQKIIIVRLE